MKNILTLMVMATMYVFIGFAQPAKLFDSAAYKYKNNIKYNLSGNLLYSNMFVLSYERTINMHQTASITGGYMEFPSFGTLVNSVKFDKNRSKSGYTIGGDYRFYLAKENRYPAPHGLYIGPYLNYYHFKNERDITATDSSGAVFQGGLSTKISIVNLGAQLGYQFVLGNRITIDLTLFAPSISRYSVEMDLSGNIPDDIHFSNEIVNGMINRFPMLNKLLSEKTLDANGKKDALAPGLKYCVYVGFRF